MAHMLTCATGSMWSQRHIEKTCTEDPTLRSCSVHVYYPEVTYISRRWPFRTGALRPAVLSEDRLESALATNALVLRAHMLFTRSKRAGKWCSCGVSPACANIV
jgi:hypothetical protein